MRKFAVALAVSALTATACVGSAPEAGPGSSADAGRPPSASAAVTPAAATQPPESNELITGAGWECIPGARVADGKLVIASGSTFLSVLNDQRLRLETRQDVAISITVEADAAPGFAGLVFWNSLPPPADVAKWFSTAAKLELGVAGGRVQARVYDGTAATPAFQYNAPGPSGPLALGVQREADALVFRVAGAEVMRTKVLGPLTGGPLFFGASVAAGQTLTVHRLVVTDGAHPRGAEIVRAVAPAAPAGAAPSLRTGAAARGRFLGAVVSSRSLRWNQQLRDVAAREFNLINTGDIFQWNRLRPTRDQYRFCAEDQYVAFAEANNMRVLAGMLAWTKNPAWLTEGTFSREEAITILREHIQTVVGRYRGRVHVWNVVNEPFDLQGGFLKGEEQIWTRLIGPEYIDMAFRWAHEADPQAVLLLNEYNAEGFNRKSDGIYEHVKGMRARGVPIHGVGMQTHWGDGRQMFPLQRFDRSTVGPNMRRLADLGLDVYITEMDVLIQKPVTPEKLAAQAQTYRQMLEVCLAATNCKALTTMGVYDGDAPSTHDPGFSGFAAPLLFDEGFQPKPAYDALAEVLRKR